MEGIKILIHNKKPEENEEKKVSNIERQNDNDGIIGIWLNGQVSGWIGKNTTKVIPDLKAFLLGKGVTITSENQNTEYQYEIIVEISKNKP